MALEESVVDPRTRTLTVKSKNLTFSNFITVEETCSYKPATDALGGYELVFIKVSNHVISTVFKQDGQIEVSGWSAFRDRIEDFCATRFQSNALKGKAALEEALERIYAETKEQLADIIRDVTGIPLQHFEETASSVSSVASKNAGTANCPISPRVFID